MFSSMLTMSLFYVNLYPSSILTMSLLCVLTLLFSYSTLLIALIFPSFLSPHTSSLLWFYCLSSLSFRLFLPCAISSSDSFYCTPLSPSCRALLGLTTLLKRPSTSPRLMQPKALEEDMECRMTERIRYGCWCVCVVCTGVYVIIA